MKRKVYLFSAIFILSTAALANDPGFDELSADTPNPCRELICGACTANLDDSHQYYQACFQYNKCDGQKTSGTHFLPCKPLNPNPMDPPLFAPVDPPPIMPRQGPGIDPYPPLPPSNFNF